MKIKEVRFLNFKRFKDLKIVGLTENVKLIVLVGPNGSGKSSVFEGFNFWYNAHAFRSYSDKDFFLKEGENFENENLRMQNSVNIDFCKDDSLKISDVRKSFYFRTAHRNSPDFMIGAVENVQEINSSKRFDRLISTDSIVSENYTRIINSTIQGIFDQTNDSITIKELRDKFLKTINTALINIFKDLQISKIGYPGSEGTFYFSKGLSKDFKYKNLSAGEKAVFDIVLDFVIKTQVLNDTIFCIDEPELHVHTSLQGKLIEEILNIISDNSQLWIATHSIGVINKAREIEETNKNTVTFLDFSNHDFDSTCIITPSSINGPLWDKFLDLAFGEFSKLIAPKTIIFCEGDVLGRKKKNFDSIVYNRIFNDKYPEVKFISVGSCSEIDNPNNKTFVIIKEVFKNSKFIKLKDRDDLTEDQVEEAKKNGIKVLKKRHLEVYLLDDEIITRLCIANNKQDKVTECINFKNVEIQKLKDGGSPDDDIKSISGNIYLGLKKLLGLKHCGSTAYAFLTDILSRLITEDTKVYKELEETIFK